MYHLVNNLTNKAGDALVGYFVKLKDADGNYATLFSDTNSTPIATVSGLANAAKTDANGMYDLYVEDGDYDIEFFDKDDSSLLVTRIPSVPMYSNTSVEAATEATLAELASTDAGKGASLVSLEDGTDLEAAVAARAKTADLASTASGKGAALVGFLQSGTGAVARTAEAKLRDIVSVKDFGAVGDNATDDTAAIQAAWDALYAANGGVLYFPRGTYRVSALSKTYSGAIPIIFRGEGKFASGLKKITGTTTPIVSIVATGIQDIYGGFEDIGFFGDAKANDGIKLTNVGRVKMDHVLVRDCDTGIHVDGSLIFRVNDPSILSNNTGVKTEANGPYANLITFSAGEIRANSSWGLDIGEGMAISFDGVDFENNGTTGNTSTGAIVIRDTVDNEGGYAVFSIKGCWFEGNYGTTISVAASNTALSISGSFFISNEAGRDVVAGAIYSFGFESNVCATGTVTVAAATSSIKNSFIATLADTSSAREHTNVITGAGNMNARIANTFIGVQFNSTGVGFNNTAPIAKPTGVPVDAAGIHAALVSLGLIAA